MNPNSPAGAERAPGADAPAARALSIGGLEAVYDELAAAIDQAGDGRTELFLVKLALLNANALGDADLFRKHLQAALTDL